MQYCPDLIEVMFFQIHGIGTDLYDGTQLEISTLLSV